MSNDDDAGDDASVTFYGDTAEEKALHDDISAANHESSDDYLHTPDHPAADHDVPDAPLKDSHTSDDTFIDDINNSTGLPASVKAYLIADFQR